jgi:hypothetical protein
MIIVKHLEAAVDDAHFPGAALFFHVSSPFSMSIRAGGVRLGGFRLTDRDPA